MSALLTAIGAGSYVAFALELGGVSLGFRRNVISAGDRVMTRSYATAARVMRKSVPRIKLPRSETWLLSMRRLVMVWNGSMIRLLSLYRSTGLVIPFVRWSRETSKVAAPLNLSVPMVPVL